MEDEDSKARWPSRLRLAAEALSRETGASIAIGAAAPVTDGWSAQRAEYPWVRRCAVSGLPDRHATSVIVKLQRAAGAAVRREHAALALLAELGSDSGPRVLGHGDDFLVLEDLGRGAAVEDCLVGDDPAVATAALVALARALGAMHATTIGHHDAFYGRLGTSAADARADRVALGGAPVAQHWTRLGELAGAGSSLPATREATADLEDALARLAEPGALLALSSGDVAPQNCRVGEPSVRLLDFETAGYRHVMLDAAHLRLPFCGAPCWARLPAEVCEAMEAAFRAELGRACPAILDRRTYAIGMATATAAWAITRLVRLPKLLAHDEPHPMGYSRRGQLLDTLQTAIDAAEVAGVFPALRAWFEQASAALRRSWPDLPRAQPLYPAFGGGRSRC